MSLPVPEPLKLQDRIAHWLFIGLIASLPFFSVRNASIGLSPPLVMMLAISAFVGIRALLSVRLPVAVTRMDLALVVYLGIALVSLAGAPDTPGAKFAFGKTVVYFGAFIALKVMLTEFRPWQFEHGIRKGILIGSIGFVVIGLLAVIMTGNLSKIFSGMNFRNSTQTVFSSLDSLLGAKRSDDFESKNVMRNAVGEVFAFYFLLTLVFRFRDKTTNTAMIALNVFLVLFMFSRRAFLAVVVGITGGTLFNEKGLRRGLAAMIVVGGVVASTLWTQEESRIADLSGGSRFEQYVTAMKGFTENPVSGYGYGSKLEKHETYVHNFVLASGYMMGAAGLLVALFVFSSTLYEFVVGMAGAKEYNTSVLLIIPLLGMMVGATVEGVFTVTAWVAFALFDTSVRRRR